MTGVYCVPAGEADPSEFGADAIIVDNGDVFWIIDEFTIDDAELALHTDCGCATSHLVAAFMSRADAKDYAARKTGPNYRVLS